jgi:hypothetical protein
MANEFPSMAMQQVGSVWVFLLNAVIQRIPSEFHGVVQLAINGQKK